MHEMMLFAKYSTLDTIKLARLLLGEKCIRNLRCVVKELFRITSIKLSHLWENLTLDIIYEYNRLVTKE